MVKAAGEAGLGMITGLVNQIIVGVIPAERELSSIVNCCCKRKRDCLERGNCSRGMKLTDQILKIAGRIIEKLM